MELQVPELLSFAVAPCSENRPLQPVLPGSVHRVHRYSSCPQFERKPASRQTQNCELDIYMFTCSMTRTGFIVRSKFTPPNVSGRDTNVENAGSVLSISTLGVPELLHEE